MSAFQAIILGLVEGLTEFLPISSTFHLIFTSLILGIEQSPFVKTFTVFIQAGAIVAVLGLYGWELWHDKSLIKNVVLSFIPTALIGLLLHSVIKKFFEAQWLMLAAFAVMGIIFIVYEWWLKSNHESLKKSLSELTWWEVSLIGVGQAAAILPGVSRAGAVMLTMMFLGVKRDQAAKYSFLLAVPTICSAAILDVYKLRSEVTISSDQILLLLIGSLTAFVSALLVLKLFIKYLQHNTLVGFGVYRLVAALFLLAFI